MSTDRPQAGTSAPGAVGAGRVRHSLMALAATTALLSCAAPAPTRVPFEPAWIVPANVLQRWHEDKARLGPTFAGSPSWRAHVDFLERELRGRGVIVLPREPVRYQRWFTADDPAAGQWSLDVAGRAVPVAAYWAYSGATPEQGVTAPLIYYDPAAPPADIAGRIVVFDVPGLPEPLPAPFRPPENAWATADLRENRLALEQWYAVNYPTRFGRLGDVLRQGGAAGGLAILPLSPGRARGLYAFPLLATEPAGVPGLFLDRSAGAAVREAARAGASATLRLLAQSAPAEAWFLSGVLPGRDYGSGGDEFVLLVTHSDGPNLTQENGGIAILSVVDYFAKLTALERPRSLLVLIDPQHYMPGRHRVDWYAAHPGIAGRIVASIGAEQFGQRGYVERGAAFVPGGGAETTLIFAQDNSRLVEIAVAAIEAERLPRAAVRVPARGQGQWAGLGDVALKRRIPGYGTSTDMTAYWSTAPGLESFDAELARRQIAVLTRLTDALMQADLDDIAVPDRARRR